jgi:Spy/CpxP family protein refolding chaperone
MKKLSLTFSLLTLLLPLFVATAYAQQPAPDPVGENLFPPELIMRNQQALNLSEEQQAFFKTEFGEAQKRFTDLQWKLESETEKFIALVKQRPVDEAQTLAQLDVLLNAERDIKRAQIQLLVRLKNKLTPEQQAKLTELRRRAGQ